MTSVNLSPEQLNEVIEALKKDIRDKELENIATNTDGKEEKIDEEVSTNTKLLDVEDKKRSEEIGLSNLIEGNAQNEDGEYKGIERKPWINRLKVIRKRYTDSFTMHALDHIINGTVLEKVFWTIKLITVLCVAIYLSRSLFTSYFSHHVDSKIQFNTKTSMQLPMVLICGKDSARVLGTYIDCSSTKSKSYNRTICTSVSPTFFKADQTMRECKEELKKEDVSCDHLLGQCVTLNAAGSAYQTLTIPGMRYVQAINSSHLPIWVLVKAPGPVELMPTPAMRLKWMKINRLGNYHFNLEKTTIIRLPYPYSKPRSCVVQNCSRATSTNMFTGNYTMDKCLATCLSRAQLKFCGTTFRISRAQVRDQVALKSLLQDKNKAQIDKCFAANNTGIHVDVQECSSKCRTPCEEENYKMKETLVEQAPSYHFSTLLANFGGTLGLMSGMSAISIIEMFIWLILFLIDRCNRVKDKVEKIQSDA